MAGIDLLGQPAVAVSSHGGEFVTCSTTEQNHVPDIVSPSFDPVLRMFSRTDGDPPEVLTLFEAGFRGGVRVG